MKKKTYYMSPFTWIISIIFTLIATYIVCFSMIMIPQILIMGDLLMMLMILVLIGAMFFAVYSALIFLDLPRSRLELSGEGVVLYSIGYQIYTPWENIASLSWTRFSRSIPTYINLKEPAAVGEISFEEGRASRRAVSEKRSWWMLVRQLKAEAQYTQFIRIPVVFFRLKDKKDGGINEYLHYYSLHLMFHRW